MAGITLEKGKLIYQNGQPMTALHLIMKGRIKVTYPGGVYYLAKGDVIGICEVCSEIHFLQYEAEEESTILTYPLSTMESLQDLVEKHPDVAVLFMVSAFRQITTLLNHCDVSELNCINLYQDITSDLETYNTLSGRYRLPIRTLEDFDSVNAYLGEESPDMWLNGYYLGLLHIFVGGGAKSFVTEPAVPLGFIRKATLDFRRAFYVLEEQFHYQQSLSQFLFHESGNDLFDMLTSLYYKLEQDSQDADNLYADINRIILQAESNPCLDSALLKIRTESFLENVALLQSSDSGQSHEEKAAAKIAELAGSLNTILDFAGPEFEAADSFRQHVLTFKALEDRNSTEDDVCALKKHLTEEFCQLYSTVFVKSLSASVIPAPVRLLMYFGYVDEELAGTANSTCLYHLMENISDNSEFGVYTFFDWLMAIYHGKKEPSRNEFDQDYFDYIHRQKAGGNFTEPQLKAMEKDTLAKVRFELANMFPSVNKMTFGRITTYCPLFTSDNVLKDLASSYVTAADISHVIDKIKKVDYTAFYRESLDKANIDLLGKEIIHLEFLPDIILMPNVGIRGAMWQEIEGRRRNSPSRMIFSIFHLEDLNTSMTRLTGEYRWEMCKRIQGGRWNDISERSLTSEYFDYVQFYRKNHELTTEAKERIRLSLQRSKNSFKEMFVRDYIIWVFFEGTGSPRMNKVARSILFNYCPFPQSICGTLDSNPLYTELLTRHRLHTAQKVHHLDMLCQKLRNGNHSVPDTIDNEYLYVKGE